MAAVTLYAWVFGTPTKASLNWCISGTEAACQVGGIDWRSERFRTRCWA
ncbi:hypothetical protein MCM47_32200 [Kitasatospora sp. A2-31]|nr:hypothetical protein [Kitasatospora sp. A2-31]